MSAEFDFLQGFDPTGAGSVSDAQLLQMIAQASGRTNRGFFIYQDATPDLASNARYAGYIWIRPSDNPKIFRYWDTGSSSWQVVPVAANAVVTASIANLAVTLAKLSPSGGTPLQLVRVNAAGDGIEFWTFVFAANTVPLTALSITGQGAWKVLQWDAAGTSLAYRTLDITTAIPDNSITPVKLQVAPTIGFTPSFMLSETPDGIVNVNKWRQIGGDDLGLFTTHINRLNPVSGNNLKSIRVNAAGNDWEFYTTNVGLTQVQLANTAVASAFSTTIPYDDTIPQNTEGTELLTVAISPLSATSKLMIEALVPCCCSTTANIIAALFKDAGANALAAITQMQAAATYPNVIKIHYEEAASSTAARTYKLRLGTSTGAEMSVNGTTGGAGVTRFMGGVMQAWLKVTEIPN